MISRLRFIPGVVIVIILAAVLPVRAEEIEEIPRLSKEEVRDLIGKSGVVLIDVRYDKSWNKSDMKIAGAVRENPNEISSWAGKYKKDSRIILYCD